VRQLVVVIDGHCRTESYSYRLQGDELAKSWLIRWEFHREPPRPDYPYPRAHVHVNGTFPSGESTGRLHVPSRRVPLELVAWHLIAEWVFVARPRTGKRYSRRLRRKADGHATTHLLIGRRSVSPAYQAPHPTRWKVR
jgi:hypothetical protein